MKKIRFLVVVTVVGIFFITAGVNDVGPYSNFRKSVNVAKG